MTKYNKQQAISIIIDCAAKYEENLNGYQLLFILKDKHKHISSLEVSFYPYNFLHLTGIKLIDGTTATDFYAFFRASNTEFFCIFLHSANILFFHILYCIA